MNDGDCIVFGGEHQEMQDNFKFYFEKIGGPEKQNDQAQEKYSSADTVQLYGDHMTKLQSQFQQGMNLSGGQIPLGIPGHSFPTGFPLQGMPPMPGVPQPVAQPVTHPSQLPPTVTPGFFSPQFSQTTPSGLLSHHFQPSFQPAVQQPVAQPVQPAPQPVQPTPQLIPQPVVQPAPQPVLQPAPQLVQLIPQHVIQPAPQPVQPISQPAPQPVQPSQPAPEVPVAQVSPQPISSTLPPLEKSASSPVGNRHSVHMSTPATGNSGLSNQSQSFSAPLEAAPAKKKGSDILHSSASLSSSLDHSKKVAEDSPRTRTKTEMQKKEESSSGGWSNLFKKNKSKLKQQKSAVASQSAPEEINADDFDQKNNSKLSLVRKLGVLVN